MAVVALVDEEARLLALEPVDVELDAVLESNVLCWQSVSFRRRADVAATNEPSFLLARDGGLKGESRLALVVDVLHKATCSLYKFFGYVLTADVHADAMSLHDGGVAVDVDDETRQTVALAVDEAEHRVCFSLGVTLDRAYKA